MNRRKKETLWHAALLLFIAAVVACAGFGVYCVVSRTQSNEYAARLKIALNAASLSSGVSVAENGEARPLDEEAYRKLYFYLSRSPALWIAPARTGEDTVELRIGDDMLFVTPRDGDNAIVLFSTSGHSYRMAIHADDLWAHFTALIAPEDA